MKTKCIKCGTTYINLNDLCTTCRGVKQNPFDMLENLDDGINLDEEQRNADKLKERQERFIE